MGVLAAAAALASVPGAAQGPEADWRTLQVRGFRVHYPAEFEAWALHAAARLPAIRERVDEAVGYRPTQTIDVVVMDPEADSNGSAWPLLGRPRMVLWTSPPAPDSQIGHYLDWAELLVTHEQVHLAHLLRPSRNPLRRLLERTLLPVGPLPLGAPRWVYEGYATLLEGRLTGSGRPNGDLRAAILRRWAQAGRLPAYGALSAGGAEWLGGSMAYLAGSAYLEWLERRAGPDCLPRLWARMSARKVRSFEAAFRGVFGDGSRELYDRFRAELTHEALEAERRLLPELREGELWQRLEWGTGEPALSPDGARLAVVLRSRKRPSRLVVWSTGSDEQERKEWQKTIDRMLRQDPQDVAPVLARPLPREPLHVLPTQSGATPFGPRWMPDGRALLYTRFEPDPRGELHPDLYRWWPEEGRVERLTRLADVRDADPAPDGRWAAAVRHRHGLSQLMRVDLGTGAVEPLTEPSVEVVVDRPRVSPDGARLAYVRHRHGSWRLVVRDLAGGAEEELPLPEEALVAQPAWSEGGRSLIAAVGRGGFIDLWRFVPQERTGRPLTRTIGAALAPAPTSDGKAVYFLGLEPHGFDLRRLDAAAAEPLGPPALAPLAQLPEPYALQSVQPGRRYGVGRLELLLLAGGVAAPAAHTLEAGLRMGDLIGRLDAILIAAIAPDGVGPRGGSLAAAWRGWPVELEARLFALREAPSEQPKAVPELGVRLDADRWGAELAAGWWWRSRTLRVELAGGALVGAVDPRVGEVGGQRLGFAHASFRHARSRELWRLSEAAEAHLEAGATAGDGWARFGGRLEAGVEREAVGLSFAWRRDWAEDAESQADRLQLGGVFGSTLPRSVLAGRVPVPALPAGTAVGDRYEGQRAELRLGPLPLFAERHRMWSADQRPGAWLVLVGVEARLSLEPLPLVGLPGLELRAGVARILDEPFENKTNWWLATAFRP